MSSLPSPDWLRTVPGGVRLTLRVTPRASADRVDGPRDGRLRVRVTAAPADGAANLAVCRLLAKRVGAARSDVSLVRGAKGREKTVEIAGVDAGEVRRALAS
jgi:uncharacterized protein (TIGR00251 family)